ncbi:MAG: UDP-N-acetylglucosamine 4,6-dehydratase (inverting) [Candidatus Limnocylindrales bacterium]
MTWSSSSSPAGGNAGLLRDQALLVTGGTGSFGRRFVKAVLEAHGPRRVVILSRDELKQYEFAEELGHDPRVRFFIGDVRDPERLWRAFDGIDFVVHAAALKQVPAAEYNPFEAVKTNILGAQNVINSAIDRGVKRVIALSTDKASSPINLYGATKLVSDKLFTAANAYAGSHPTRFAVVRYGNVSGSRGSVVPLFRRLAKTGVIPITDERMTRFWITLDQGVDFVIRMLGEMHGGELFVPKIPSIRVVDLAMAVAPDCRLEVVGIRPGEKLHEEMIGVDDARRVLDAGDFYLMAPDAYWWEPGSWSGVKKAPEDFRYTSDTNTEWLTVDQLRALAG